MPHSGARYTRISKAEEADGQALLEPESPTTLPRDNFGPYPSNTNPLQRRRRALREYWPILVGATFFLASLVLFYLSLRNPDVQCAKRLSAYSPALDAVEYREVVFNGSLRHASEFRGPPSPEVDAAWDRISDLRPIRILADDLANIGREPRPSLVKYHEEFGGGYLATIEIAHHMHCLNMIRKRTYWDYYAPFDGGYQKDPQFYRVHLDHCIELLRQRLMCTADVGLITFDWVAGHRNPWPNFSTQHQCRDFDKLLDWNEAHGVTIRMANVTRTPGVVDLLEGP